MGHNKVEVLKRGVQFLEGFSKLKQQETKSSFVKYLCSCFLIVSASLSPLIGFNKNSLKTFQDLKAPQDFVFFLSLEAVKSLGQIVQELKPGKNGLGHDRTFPLYINAQLAFVFTTTSTLGTVEDLKVLGSTFKSLSEIRGPPQV